MKLVININQDSAVFKDDPRKAMRDIFNLILESNFKGSVETSAFEANGGKLIYSYRVLEHTLSDGTVRKP